MDKKTTSDIKPIRSRGRTNAKQPQILDLRPGHVKAVAALRAKQGRSDGGARPIDGMTQVKRSTATRITETTADIKPSKAVAATSKPMASAKATKPKTAPTTKPVTTTVKPAKSVAAASTKTATRTTPNNNSKNSVDKWARLARRKLDKVLDNIKKHGTKFILDRWDHIRMARRSVVLWLSLILLLICGSFLQTIWYDHQIIAQAPANGGIYAEGAVDKLTTISPLYASTDTEKAASQLVYPGLLSYDDANKLHGELAESWTMNDTGQVWTVKLKPSLTWSDGQPITTRDVVFTVNLMKNSDINTNLSSTWQTIEANATDNQTVEFKLTSPLISFDSALTFGILPQHILDGKNSMTISSLFSQTPKEVVGAGPFKLDKIENNNDRSIWHFKPNDRYYGNIAKIGEFIIRTYNDNDSLVDSLKRGEVNAISSVKVGSIAQLSTDNFKVVQLKTANGVYALFNNDGEITSNATIRAALRLGLDRATVRNKLIENNQQLQAPADLETPIATGVYDSVDKLHQPDYNLNGAKRLLDEAGWIIPAGGKYRYKGDQELALKVVTIAGTNYEIVAKAIAEQWQQLGINATVESINAAQAQQNYLVPRNYDVLVYQMHLGADPDMFAYWSSTQAQSTGLNLSNYRSRRAELALSAGRTNANATAREARYVAFVNQWLTDNPAIALYQPSLFYVMRQDIHTLDNGDSVIDASNRFVDVADWTAATAPVMATP